jgi:hypothetical protein
MTSEHPRDYLLGFQLAFGKNRGAALLTLPENMLGLRQKNLITSGAAWMS